MPIFDTRYTVRAVSGGNVSASETTQYIRDPHTSVVEKSILIRRCAVGREVPDVSEYRNACIFEGKQS